MVAKAFSGLQKLSFVEVHKMLYFSAYQHLMNLLIKLILCTGMATACYAQPDLRTSKLSASIISVVPGETLSPTLYENNLGNLKADAHKVGYYLSSDSLWDASDLFISTEWKL